MQRKVAEAMTLVKQLEEETAAAKESGTKRKPMLPGFVSHRERCNCVLCKKQRKERQQLIDQTKGVREVLAAQLNPPVGDATTPAASSPDTR